MNVLLVDDETYVIDYLLSAVEWEEAGIEEVYYAYSGQEALKIVEEHTVNMLLTDVRMPGMNGLELIRRLEPRNIKSIVLSGHADFDYAQQAMKHHAVNYLLKPARAGEVLDAVKQVATMIREEWQEIASLQNAIRSLQENEPLLRQSFIRGMLRGKIPSAAELRHKQSQMNIPFSIDDACRLMLVRIDGQFGKLADSVELMDFAIDNIAQELLGKQFQFLSGKDELGNHVYIVKARDTSAAKQIEAAAQSQLNERAYNELEHTLEQTAEMLLQTVPQYLQSSISVSLGRIGHFPDDIPSTYEAALQQLRFHVKTKGSLLIDSGESEAGKKYSETALDQLYAPPVMLHLLEAGQWDRCEEKLQAIMQDVEQREQITTGHLLEVYHSLANAFFYILHKSGKQPLALLSEDSYQMDFSHKVTSFAALQAWAIHALSIVRGALEVDELDEHGQVVEKVHRYVEAHLHEDIALQDLADYVYLHPAYLSTVYKSTTGEGVSSYMYRRKMEVAANLLRKSTQKITDIAEAVGYQNTSYFIRVFKKYYGCTPQKYRAPD